MIDTQEIRSKTYGIIDRTDFATDAIRALCDEVDRLRAELAKVPQIMDTEWRYKTRRVFLETNDERDVMGFRECAHNALWGKWGFPHCERENKKMLNTQEIRKQYRVPGSQIIDTLCNEVDRLRTPYTIREDSNKVKEMQAEIKRLQAIKREISDRASRHYEEWKKRRDEVNELREQVRRLEGRAFLGYATTRDLLSELSARFKFQCKSGLDYKPVDEVTYDEIT